MPQDGSDDSDGIINPALVGRLLPFLAESVVIYGRAGEMKARISPPGGILGHASGAGTNVFAYVHPDDVPAGMQVASAMVDSAPGWRGCYSVRLLHADGAYRRYELRVFNHLDDPELDGVVLCVREAFDDSGRFEPGVKGEDLVTSMADAIPTASLILDHLGRIRHASEAAAELFGQTTAELFGQALASLAVGEAGLVLEGALANAVDHPGRQTVVFGYRRGSDDLVVEALIHARDDAGRSSVITVVLTDRTDEPDLIRLATRDALTGLANRAQVTATLDGLLTMSRPDVSVVFCDLDRLKLLNDTYGHDTGDRALVSVADQLRAHVRDGDLVGRIGGDEFVLLCPGLANHEAHRLATRLCIDVHFAAPDGGHPVRLSAGAATARPGDTVQGLLHRADERMFTAKRQGGIGREVDGADLSTTRQI